RRRCPSRPPRPPAPGRRRRGRAARRPCPPAPRRPRAPRRAGGRPACARPRRRTLRCRPRTGPCRQ
ncbi:hypothetical protein GB881_19610, partial [Georgenia subflava]|nr:hypothetical protein [Georgenia subflava]